jgi:hypothetical protein
MSGVHNEIAVKALSVQPEEFRNMFNPFIEELKKSSWYPDYFADRSMSKQKKDEIDPEADRFIYPDPPKSTWQKRFMKLSEKYSYSDAPPLKQVHLISYYLKNAVESLRNGDMRSAVKFCGVYSHVIADICEPIHALSPAIIDVIAPPPEKYIGLELHANVEGVHGPVEIDGYRPKSLGANMAQAEMGAYAGLMKAHKFGASMATPIVQVLYAGKKDEAKALSGLAQSESAKHFADFLFTVYNLAFSSGRNATHILDLRKYPYVTCDVDMLYRYAPTVDVSLIPYSGGKLLPMQLKSCDGVVEDIQGLGVVPFLGPPNTPKMIRETCIEYFLVPGAYQKFSATVGLHPGFEESVCSAVFHVIGDGKELAKSDVMRASGKSMEITATLGRTRWLKLIMRYVNNPTDQERNSVKSHLAWVSHGIWGNAVLK